MKRLILLAISVLFTAACGPADSEPSDSSLQQPEPGVSAQDIPVSISCGEWYCGKGEKCCTLYGHSTCIVSTVSCGGVE
jgi:hypothetical protein